MDGGCCWWENCQGLPWASRGGVGVQVGGFGVLWGTGREGGIGDPGARLQVQLAGVLELRVLSARGGPCRGPPSCRLVFRLCLRPSMGIGCSLGAAHSPPGPPPTPGAPRILRLPFTFSWPVRIPPTHPGGAKIWASLGSYECPFCGPPQSTWPHVFDHQFCPPLPPGHRLSHHRVLEAGGGQRPRR